MKPIALIASVFVLFMGSGVGVCKAEETRKPNVVFIAVDDLNDWLGCMGTHPMVKTPHIDALAARGTLFTNAHTNSTLCNPSRTSLMLGLRPTSTGIYGLLPWFRDVPEFADLTTLPQHFANHGYRTLTTGKIYHAWRKPRRGEKHVEFEIVGPEGGLGTRPPKKLIGDTPFGNHSAMDWGVWPPDNDDTKTADYQVAQWAADRITQPPAGDDRPYFLAAGFFFPHVPCYATQKWFDLYPNDASILPEIPADDRADTPRSSWWLHWSLPEPRLRWLQENDQHIHLVRSYLACISFIDSLVGKITAAVEASGQADNTILVLWSDHGYHLGEKDISGKNTLWARSTRVPLILAGPGITPGQVCTRPVELLDLYPSLTGLANLPQPAHPLEGLSLVPQLRDSTAPRERPAISTHNQGNHAVITEDWRFIRYVDGAEELYNLRRDPAEWHNLAATHPDVCAALRQHLPRIDRGPAPGSAHRVLTYYDKTPVWEGDVIKPDAPIPHDTPP